MVVGGSVSEGVLVKQLFLSVLMSGQAAVLQSFLFIFCAFYLLPGQLVLDKWVMAFCSRRDWLHKALVLASNVHDQT